MLIVGPTPPAISCATELRPRLVVIELIGTSFGHEGNSPERAAALLNEYGYDAVLERPLPDTFHETVLFRPK